MPAAAKKTLTSAELAAVTCVVLVTWTAGETDPRIEVALEESSAVFIARNTMDRNAERIAQFEAARAALIEMGNPALAAQLVAPERVRCQVKRLHGERAMNVLRAANAVEQAHDDEANREDVPGAEAALIAAYLAR